MTKQEWEKLHDNLDKLDREFSLKHSDAENGKNIKIRKNAQKDIDGIKETVIGYIRNNPDAYDLFVDESKDGQVNPHSCSAVPSNIHISPWLRHTRSALPFCSRAAGTYKSTSVKPSY